MKLKDATVPELLDILNALLNRTMSDKDREIAAVLAKQRTFTRAEKVLISSLCTRYAITQSFIDSNLVSAA